MTRAPDVLDRLAPSFPAPADAYETLLRRRDRRQRTRKVAATTLVTALAAAFVAVGLSMSGQRSIPADEPIPIGEPTVWSFGEIGGWITYADRAGDDVMAIDPDHPLEFRGVVLDASGTLRPLDWSADGSRLLLSEERGGSLNLLVANADGTISRPASERRSVSWGPSRRTGTRSSMQLSDPTGRTASSLPLRAGGRLARS